MSPKPSSGETVGIVTGNFAPFRIIVRDEADEWQPTLEQINNRDYDYVKLHRLSTFVDVGISPFSLGICFDGTLVLPATGKFQDRSAALAIFNKLLSELLIGGLYCESVTPDDIGYGQMSLTAYTRMLGGAHGPAASFAYASRMKCIGTLDVIRLLEPERLLVSQLQTTL